jgi:biotin operon repressor
MTTTTSRLLGLLSLLQTRRDWPGSLLAERLEISPRTVRRDVDRLREMGYRISATMGPDGGYRLDAGTELPPLLFDDDQVIALAVALQAATGTGVGIEEAAVRALTTVRQVLPSRLRHRLDALEFTTMARPGVNEVATAVLLALSTAVRAREVLRFDYASVRAGSPRRVEPHHLVTHSGRWYLVAWDLERADWRLFRADRITPRTPTGPRFAPRTVPGGRPVHGVGPNEHLAVPGHGDPAPARPRGAAVRGRRHCRAPRREPLQPRGRGVVVGGAGRIRPAVRHRDRGGLPARARRGIRPARGALCRRGERRERVGGYGVLLGAVSRPSGLVRGM